MLRAAAETRLRCVDHPHRRATRQCSHCKQGYCDECAARMGDRTICERCQTELEEKHRIEHPPVEERVRRFTLSLRNTAILLVILGLLAIPGSYAVRNLTQTPITPEEFARFRYAMAGTFETQEGTNITSTVLGAKVVSATSEQPGYEAKRLIDEYVGEGYGGYRTADSTFPQEVVIEAGQRSRVEKVTFQQQPNEPPETWTREVEVLVSVQSPDGPYESIGRFTLAQNADLQRFVLDAGHDVQWVKLRVLSNYGGPFASLAEFDSWLQPRGAFGPNATPSAQP